MTLEQLENVHDLFPNHQASLSWRLLSFSLPLEQC